LENFAKTVDQDAHGAERLETAPAQQWYRAFLLIVIVCTTYLSVPLVSGGRLLVPSFPTVALIPLLVLAARRNISVGDFVFMFNVGVLLVASIALSPGHIYANEKILGLIQCFMAIAVALLVVRLMQQMRFEVLERTLCVIWLLVVIGSILEVVGILTAPSDAFRQWAYSGTYTLYDAVSRDINMVGWLRPKVFSVEPSHVTKFFVAAINSWLLVRVTWNKVWVTLMATLLMLMIMGSPMLLISASITFAVVLWNRNTRIGTKVGMLATALVVAVLFGTYYDGSRYSVIADRVLTIGDSTVSDADDLGSEEKRVVYPYVALMDTWSRWPFFGVGIGGKEVVFENSEFSFRDPESALGNNVLAEMGIYLGMVGALWFIFVLAHGAARTGVERLGLLAVMIVLFSQLMGGVISFRYWGYIALIWGALAFADSLEARRLPKT
jgi:hypothetical protein